MTNTAPLKLLIDTNVWLDNYDGSRSTAATSRNFFDLACEREDELLYSVTTIKDIYYLVSRTLKQRVQLKQKSLSEQDMQALKTYSESCIENITQVATCIAADATDLWLARKYQRIHSDFEDCLIMAAAKRANADFVVTNDVKFLERSAVPALSPEQMIAFLKT